MERITADLLKNAEGPLQSGEKVRDGDVIDASASRSFFTVVSHSSAGRFCGRFGRALNATSLSKNCKFTTNQEAAQSSNSASKSERAMSLHRLTPG